MVRCHDQSLDEAVAGVAQLQTGERFEQPGRDRDGAEDAPATLLERLEDQQARRRIDSFRGEGESSRYSTAGEGENFAEGSNRRICRTGDLQKAVPLMFGAVFALSTQVVELVRPLRFSTSAG